MPSIAGSLPLQGWVQAQKQELAELAVGWRVQRTLGEGCRRWPGRPGLERLRKSTGKADPENSTPQSQHIAAVKVIFKWVNWF